MQFRRLFVTGAGGYVGSALVPALLARGHDVVAYDLFLYGDVLAPHPRLQQVTGDIRDAALVLTASAGCDAVLHLACISNDPSFDLDPALGKAINFDAFKNVISACETNRVRRLIVASSTSQYGVKPSDVDVVQSYENFTGGVLMSLVEHGFFKAEEANDFLTPENLMAPSGKLPLNTSGGNLAECYMHGLELQVEAVRQLRGQSTAQVKDADVAMVISGPMVTPVSSMILGSEATL